VPQKTSTLKPSKPTKPPTYGLVKGGVRVKHTEYVTTINRMNAGHQVLSGNTVTYENMLVLGINPGDGMLCPWLSNVATSYKHYKINSLTLTYDSSVSTFTDGALAIGPSYDPDDLDTQPLTIAELMTREGAVKGNVWENFSMKLKPMSQPKLVRSKALTAVSGEHLRQTDHALVYCALYNIQDNAETNAYGDITVTYDITLTDPCGSRNQAKCHRIQAPSQNFGASIRHDPVFIYTQHKTDHVNEEDETKAFYNHHAENVGHPGSTLAVRCHTGIVGKAAGAVDVVANRFVFDEPFTGLLTVNGKHDPITPISDRAPLPEILRQGMELATGTFGYLTAKRPLTQAASAITGYSIVDNSKFTRMWNIVAKAGDVLDMTMDRIDSFIDAERTLTWTELAPEVIEASLLV